MANVITDKNILIRVLKNPELMTSLDASEWNALLSEARISNLAGRVAADAESLKIIDLLPAKVQNLFKSFTYNSLSSARMIRWEMNRVMRALKGSDEKVILLKGAAYLDKGLSCTRGRISVDLDILVPKKRIDWVEEKFIAAGWQHQLDNDYDQKFYREYAHELPPMVHPDRRISIDVHHSILPVTSRVSPDMSKLIKDAVKSKSGFYTFSDVDIILHSVVHQFQDGELRSSLRNLLEQHDMLNEFGKNAGFWEKLVPRAIELGLTRALYYALRYTQMIMGTEIPDTVMADIRPYGPNPIVRNIMDWMVPGVISPSFGITGFARWVAANGLYIRSHWLRMPPLLLTRHLTIKFFRRFSMGG
ncbi:MAG: nucleotidyltransferase family protein [Kordiimonadaceae bacterium]|nr:nucleotidyltransferase family protein [Kordiimonadaceae bacterium]